MTLHVRVCNVHVDKSVGMCICVDCDSYELGLASRQGGNCGQQDDAPERSDERARGALAEGVELLADGEPVRLRVPLVSQVDDRGRCGGSSSQQHQHGLERTAVRK